MFFDVFDSLCKKNGISCKRAAEDIGLSNSITTKWKKTGATPSGDTLNKIADYFCVSVDFLLGNQDKEKTTTVNSGGFSEKDVRLVAWFNSLSEEKQKAILSLGGAPEDLAE